MTIKITTDGLSNITGCVSNSLVIDAYICSGVDTCIYPGIQDINTLITTVTSTPSYTYAPLTHSLSIPGSETEVGVGLPEILVTIDSIQLQAILDGLTGPHNIRIRLTCLNGTQCASTGTNGIDVDGNVDCIILPDIILTVI